MKKQMKKRTMKILLATDGSAHSKVAVEEVAGRPYPPNTKVRIVTAYQTTPLTMRMEPMGTLHEYHAEIERNALKAAEKITEDAANILRKKNPSLTVTTISIGDSPKSAIVDEAETFGADLIVVGTHGYGRVKGFLLGSVSHAVSLHAKCSVEIVRKTNKKNKK